MWVSSFGHVKLMSRSCNSPLLLGLFAIILQHAKSECTSNIMLSFLKSERCLFSSVPELLPEYHPEDSLFGKCYFSAFLLCLFWERVAHLVAWPQLPLLILLGSIALANTTVACGFGHICPFFIISTELLFPFLSFLIQCPLCPSLLLRQDWVMRSSSLSLIL